jgi:NhaP-type Na+/H+ and K+/H+ antiporter
MNVIRLSLSWCNLHTRIIVACALLLGAVGSVFGVDVGNASWLFALLLGVGLLSSTFGIDLSEMRLHDWRTLIWAVTVGVTVKAVLIGATMFCLTGGDLRFFIIAITVAQMDPLSVAALTDKAKLSPRADNLLRAWAALDDPITVLLTVIAFVVVRLGHIDIGMSFDSIQVTSLTGFGIYAVQNVAFMATLVFLWQQFYAKSNTKSYAYKLTLTLAFIIGGVLIGSTWFWMFGVALVGIFLRPDSEEVTAKVQRILEIATSIAFTIAGIVVGVLLAKHGIDPLRGVALGICAFVSQIIVTRLLPARKKMSRSDLLYLAGGHQNGVTACLLGLATGTAPIVVPAIVVTHVLHFAWNTALDRHYAKAL